MSLGELERASARGAAEGGDPPALVGRQVPRPGAAAAASECPGHIASVHALLYLPLSTFGNGDPANADQMRLPRWVFFGYGWAAVLPSNAAQLSWSNTDGEDRCNRVGCAFSGRFTVAHTYEELKKKTVAELRELASTLQHEAVQGYTQLNKDHLLPALCKALGIEAHQHQAAIDAQKNIIKQQMRDIKAASEKAREAGDHDALHRLRRQYHGLNHALRTSAKRAMLKH